MKWIINNQLEEKTSPKKEMAPKDREDPEQGMQEPTEATSSHHHSEQMRRESAVSKSPLCGSTGHVLMQIPASGICVLWQQ